MAYLLWPINSVTAYTATVAAAHRQGTGFKVKEQLNGSAQSFIDDTHSMANQLSDSIQQPCQQLTGRAQDLK